MAEWSECYKLVTENQTKLARNSPLELAWPAFLVKAGWKESQAESRDCEQIIECELLQNYLFNRGRLTMIHINPGSEQHLERIFLSDQALVIGFPYRLKRLVLSILHYRSVFASMDWVMRFSKDLLYCLTGGLCRESVEGSVCPADRMDQTQLW